MTKPFRILGLQQIAIGGPDRLKLRRLWVDVFGLGLEGDFTSERENVVEDIAGARHGPDPRRSRPDAAARPGQETARG
jgi:lactoylglutathione lyase